MTSVPLTAGAPDTTAYSTTPGESDDPGEFRRFMRMWATGIAVVTSRSGALPVGCTVTALTSVSLDPPLLLVSLDHRSHTLAALSEQRRFGLNLLAAHQSRLAMRFATPCADRFSGVPHEIVGKVPILDGALAAAVCHVERTIAVADHMLVLGTPAWCTGPARERGRSPLIRFDGASRPLPESEA